MTMIASHWLWIAAGILLIAIEALAPGLFMFWVGLAALATGLVLLATALSVPVQFVLFGIFGLAMILLGRALQRREHDTPTDQPFLNERGRAMIGKSYPLETAISGGSGTVRIGDSVWRVVGPDMVPGAMVTIKAVDGGTLVVTPA
jgi:inner membrane protein